MLNEQAPQPEPEEMGAACAGMSRDSFYPFYGNASETTTQREVRERRARAICQVCVIREECLDTALANQELYGIWGGMNEVERRRMINNPRRRAG